MRDMPKIVPLNSREIRLKLIGEYGIVGSVVIDCESRVLCLRIRATKPRSARGTYNGKSPLQHHSRPMFGRASLSKGIVLTLSLYHARVTKLPSSRSRCGIDSFRARADNCPVFAQNPPREWDPRSKSKGRFLGPREQRFSQFSCSRRKIAKYRKRCQPIWGGSLTFRCRRCQH